MNTCKTCKHWTRHKADKIMYEQCWEQIEMVGDCSISDDVGDDEKNWRNYFGAGGGGNYDSFECGEDFGCINWSERVEPSKPPKNAS